MKILKFRLWLHPLKTHISPENWCLEVGRWHFLINWSLFRWPSFILKGGSTISLGPILFPLFDSQQWSNFTAELWATKIKTLIFHDIVGSFNRDPYIKVNHNPHITFVHNWICVHLPLKMDGWNTSYFLVGWPIFRGELLFLGRVKP